MEGQKGARIDKYEYFHLRVEGFWKTLSTVIFHSKSRVCLDTVAHNCNTSTFETESVGLPQIQD